MFDFRSSMPRRLVLAGAAVIALGGCKTTSYAGATNPAYFTMLVESSVEDQDWRAGVQTIRYAPKKVDKTFVPWLEENAHLFPASYLYALADRTYKANPEKAVHWFFAARVRHAYDLMRCRDRDSLIRLEVYEDRFRTSVLKFAAKQPWEAHKAAESGLEWEFENDVPDHSPEFECRLAAQDIEAFLLSNRRGVRTVSLPNKGNMVKVSGHSEKILSKARRFVAEDVDDMRFSFVSKSERRKKSKRQRGARHGSVIRWQRYGWIEDADRDHRRRRPADQNRPDTDRPWIKANRDATLDRVTGDGWTPVNY